VVEMRILKIILLLAFIAICHMPYAICNLFAQDKIIAIVNNEVITQKDLSDFLNFMRMQLSAQYKGRELEDKIQSLKPDLLDKLVEDRLILGQAQAANIKVDEARVKARIDELRRRYPSERDFQEALAEQGLTQADVESKIRDQMLMYSIIDAKIKSKIVVAPSEVTDFYEQHRDEFQAPEEREFEVMTIDKEDVASAVAKDLKSGQNFKETADKFSLNIDKIAAEKGRDLNKETEDIIFKLAVGEISQPIKIRDIFYIFKLDKIDPPRQQPLSEVQDKISEFLYASKMQEALSNWLDELKKQSYIKILQN